MCFFISLIPATIWLIIGYFVLFSSTKTAGGIQKFGLVLSTWVFVIAALIPLMGLYVTFSGLCPMTEIMEQMHES
jgi:hypothetical protein